MRNVLCFSSRDGGRLSGPEVVTGGGVTGTKEMH